MSDYPPQFIRGIKNESFIQEDGKVRYSLFSFEKAERVDNMLEVSINWEDDEKAIDFSLTQLKTDGEIKYRAGIATVDRGNIDILMKSPPILGLLSYERARIDINKYHGNLLLNPETIKTTRRLIQSGIACYVIQVIPQPESL